MTTTPSASPYNEISRIDCNSPDGDRPIDSARHELGRAIWIRSSAKHGESHFDDLVAIATWCIHDDACNAELAAGTEHDRAHQGRRLIAFAIDNQHVTRLCEGHRCVDHQIVAGPYLDGKRGTGNFHRV
jgi:hypothetical protein